MRLKKPIRELSIEVDGKGPTSLLAATTLNRQPPLCDTGSHLPDYNKPSSMQSPDSSLMESPRSAFLRRKREHEDDDTLSTTNDSMRPLAEPRKPRRKRQRTILDAMHSISLKPEFEDDADSSQAVASQDDYYYSDTSSLDDDTAIQDYASPDTSLLLSDKEKLQKQVERKVMLELVFGPEKDPVDTKIDKIIRQSMSQGMAKDDMSVQNTRTSSDFETQSELQRSSSLPDLSSYSTNGADEMDTD